MHIHALMEKASQHLDAGQHQQAHAICEEILRSAPNYAPAYYLLGVIAADTGNLMQSAELMKRSIALAPDIAMYNRSLCEVLRRMGRVNDAISYGQRATGLAPSDPEAFYNLGLAMADAGMHSTAIECYQRCLSLAPNHDRAANNLGSSLERSEQIDAAELAYRHAISLNPKNAEAQNNLGALFSGQGMLDDARLCFDAAISANPFFIEAHSNISTIKTYKRGDAHIAILESMLAQAGNLPIDTAAKYWFSLAKMQRDLGDKAQAMDAYLKANHLKRSTFHYDEVSIVALAEQLMRHCGADILSKAGGPQDGTPIFVLGMPRSGTTLVEQILSSHPDVHGAGELKYLSDAIEKVIGPLTPSLAARAASMTEQNCDDIGNAYLEKLRSHDAKTAHITDKMPGNFMFAGLIARILPQARIVHIVRDPMDTCLSNFQTLFSDVMPFAYDLAELGRYHRMHDRLMDHWKSVLPEGRILTVRYEDVVEDIEGQARRLLEYCGLPWNPACLAFHNNKRLVKTASVSQVRQPLYRSSVGRWHGLEAWLKPLQDALQVDYA